MSTRVVDRVDDWENRPFSGGYRRLQELADEDFSGVIRSGGAELYMTKGAAVGIRRGDIEDFEGGDGTLFEAPSPALPLLAIMQENGDEVRAKYYSEKTAISEVDSTLTSGGFTGFIELSENVLSGDYYQVYHAGQSMSVGFVGESARLIDGDEAFETADDEVGIYKVRPVEIEQIEIPEPEEPPEETTTDASAGDASGTGPETGESQEVAADDEGQSDTSKAGGDTPAESTTQQDADPQPTDAAGGTDQGTEARQTDTAAQGETAETNHQTPSGDAEGQANGTDQRAQQSAPAPEQDRESPQARETETESGPSERTQNRTDRTPPQSGAGQTEQRAEKRGTGGDPGYQQPRSPDAGRRQQEGQRERGQSRSDAGGLDLETRAVPSLDPEQTIVPEQAQGSARGDSLERAREQNPSQSGVRREQQTAQPGRSQPGQERGGQSRDQGQPSQRGPADGERRQQERQQGQSGRPPERTDQQPDQQPQETVDTERIEELEAEIEERDQEIEQLESELERKTTEYDDVKEQLETVRAERDELAGEVEQLEEELERLETEFGAATDAERRMTGAEALSGTDIFVRYHSKGDATLEKAHDGSHRREDVNENLRLEKHTQFDAHSVSVGGQSYAEFLESTLEYQFVEWTVRQLLFEIRDTGHAKALKDLYDVLPAVDRAELAGVVEVVYSEDGQETRTQESFDIVLRNRMGNPLLVANLNDSREAATESMMENLITAAERVGQGSDEFAGAFLVTRSFFEPGALETASDATKGGLLSRDKRKSFVNLSRKQGYHLCLVEARNENFHLAVPEL